MILVAYSNSGERAIQSFNKCLDEDGNLHRNLLKKKILLCPHKISLITSDGVHIIKNMDENVSILFQSWRIICQGGIESQLNNAWQTINLLGEAVDIPDEILAKGGVKARLYRFKNKLVNYFMH